MYWKNYPETFLQSLHVAKIILSWFVALSVALHLRIGREAGNPALTNQALAGERDTRKGPAATLAQLEETIPTLIEFDRMGIDLATVLTRKDQISLGSPRFDFVTNREQRLSHLRHIDSIQDDVEVGVITRLFSEKSIYAPAAIEPNTNSDIVESLEHLKNRFDIHRANPTPVLPLDRRSTS